MLNLQNNIEAKTGKSNQVDEKTAQVHVCLEYIPSRISCLICIIVFSWTGHMTTLYRILMVTVEPFYSGHFVVGRDCPDFEGGVLIQRVEDVLWHAKHRGSFGSSSMCPYQRSVCISGVWIRLSRY